MKINLARFGAISLVCVCFSAFLAKAVDEQIDPLLAEVLKAPPPEGEEANEEQEAIMERQTPAVDAEEANADAPGMAAPQKLGEKPALGAASGSTIPFDETKQGAHPALSGVAVLSSAIADKIMIVEPDGSTNAYCVVERVPEIAPDGSTNVYRIVEREHKPSVFPRLLNNSERWKIDSNGHRKPFRSPNGQSNSNTREDMHSDSEFQKDDFSRRFQINGGAGGDSSLFGNGELSFRLSNYFDTALRFSYAKGEEKVAHRGRTRHSYTTYSVYRSWYSYRYYPVTHYYYSYYTYYETEETSGYNGDIYLVFNPFRKRLLAPYIGLGAGYSSIDTPDKNDDGVALSLRAGLSLNWRWLTLKGEYFKHDNSNELIGDIGFKATRRLGLHAVVEKFEFDDSKSYTMFGGGLSLDF